MKTTLENRSSSMAATERVASADPHVKLQRLPSVSVKPLVRHGKAAREILHAAETLDADLIVLATHRRSALGRLLLGSTAPHVERHARCPVLLIRCDDSSATETVLWQETQGAGDRWQPQPAT